MNCLLVIGWENNFLDCSRPCPRAGPENRFDSDLLGTERMFEGRKVGYFLISSIPLCFLEE